MAEESMLKNRDREQQSVEKQRCPFTVPEGYFEDFSERMMALLSEQFAIEQRAISGHRHEKWWTKWYPYIAAACLCAIIVGGATLYFHSSNNNQEQETIVQEASSPNYLIDQIADYAMMDNADFYNYLANGD